MGKKETAKKTLTDMFTDDTPEPQTAEPATAATPEAEQPEPKKRRRKSIIDSEPLPGKDLPEKPKRQRKGKPPAMKKTHSITVYCTEQLYTRFKRVAEAQELSVNGIITRLMRRYVIEHDIDLEDFRP